MASLSQAIKSFREETISLEELLVEVDHIIVEGRGNASWLLTTLRREHKITPLSEEVHEAIKHRIREGVKRRIAQTILTADKASIKGEGDLLNNRFLIGEQVGTGDMCTVYKAFDKKVTKANDHKPYVAAKILHTKLLSHAQPLIALQSEIDKFQNLTHPNIAKIYGFDHDGATTYITMEYYTGRSLAQIMQAADFKNFSETEALRLLDGIADALQFAHSNHIIHADFKPASVLVSTSGEVRVANFGFAGVFQPSQAQLRQTRRTRGSLQASTSNYASPERLEGKKKDPRDDVFSLGCVAYEILTGRHPFGKMLATEMRARQQELQHRSGLSQRHWQAIQSALEFERDDRTPTVAQFCADMCPQRQFLPVVLAVGISIVAAIGVIGYIAMTQMPAPKPPVELAEKPLVAPKIELAPKQQHVAGTIFKDCPTCPQLVVIPAGSFRQGSPATDNDGFINEHPQHRVTLNYPLAVGIYEVTVAEYEKFVAATGYQAEGEGCWAYEEEWQQQKDEQQEEGYNWASPGFVQQKKYPVSCISWQDTQLYLTWLSKTTQKKYRLLSASEWEYVARAKSTAIRNWGQQSVACEFANIADQSAEQQYPGWKIFECNDGYPHSAPVGSFRANNFGVYDMLGNVFEWVDDCFHKSYLAAPTDGSAWLSGNCTYRELRGGSWFSRPRYVRWAFRNHFEPNYRSSSFGFRVARVIQHEKK